MNKKISAFIQDFFLQKKKFYFCQTTTLKAPRKQMTKFCLPNFMKDSNLNSFMLKTQGLEAKHCRSDPVETALYEPSHLNLQCLQIFFMPGALRDDISEKKTNVCVRLLTFRILNKN